MLLKFSNSDIAEFDEAFPRDSGGKRKEIINEKSGEIIS